MHLPISEKFRYIFLRSRKSSRAKTIIKKNFGLRFGNVSEGKQFVGCMVAQIFFR